MLGPLTVEEGSCPQAHEGGGGEDEQPCCALHLAPWLGVISNAWALGAGVLLCV